MLLFVVYEIHEKRCCEQHQRMQRCENLKKEIKILSFIFSRCGSLYSLLNLFSLRSFLNISIYIDLGVFFFTYYFYLSFSTFSLCICKYCTPLYTILVYTLMTKKLCRDFWSLETLTSSSLYNTVFYTQYCLLIFLFLFFPYFACLFPCTSLLRSWRSFHYGTYYIQLKTHLILQIFGAIRFSLHWNLPIEPRSLYPYENHFARKRHPKTDVHG